jgi:mRNA interferase RelE/StbE
MTYRVVLTRSAARELQRLPDKVAPAIVEALYGAVSENPQRAGRRLSLQLEGRWSARRGEYRIVYQIDESAETVTVLRIGHRREVYRRL